MKCVSLTVNSLLNYWESS